MRCAENVVKQFRLAVLKYETMQINKISMLSLHRNYIMTIFGTPFACFVSLLLTVTNFLVC